MDSLITAAARALAMGDPLGALNWIALRDDPPALALRGIAMARLGDFARANGLLRRAARAFGTKHKMARARCALAEAEIALVARELDWPAAALKSAREILEEQGDPINADYARHLEIRHLLLVGRIDEAGRALEQFNPAALLPALHAAHQLVVAGVAIRQLRIGAAKAALMRAQEAAQRARIPALQAEVANAMRILTRPAARRMTGEGALPLLLEQVEAILTSEALVVDACRYLVRAGGQSVSLAKRPVLFSLARALGEAWPGEAPREALIARAFRLQLDDESQRARLRVEIGRLRRALRDLADVKATRAGFVLAPRQAREVVVLAQPVEEKYAALLALLADGEAWSSSALALVAQTSPRTVQRALDALESQGKVQSFGRGRARRWQASAVPGFTTILLLPGPLPGD